ncbi:MAG TPA: hypothetical protein VGO93_05805 [Candidatus Xenobia bacterium]
MRRFLIAISCVWALAAGACPAHAALWEAFPAVSFSGYVQGVGQQTATVETANGAVVVPCDNSQFLAAGVMTSPFALPVGSPVVVSLPATVAPQLAVANLAPVPYGVAAFPATFNSYMVASSGPTLYEPVQPAVAVENPVQYSYENVAPVSYTASWPAVPPAPVVSYNAFEPPSWTEACTQDVVYESAWQTPAPALAAYAPCSWGVPYTAVPYYQPYPFWDTSAFSVSVAQPGFSLGYSAFSPGYGYPYGGYGGFGFNQASIGLDLGDVSLGFSSFGGSPWGGGYPYYGGSFSSLGIGFDGIDLNFGSFNPGFPAVYPAFYPAPYPYPAFAAVGYPSAGFNPFVGPITPLYPCFQPGFVQTAFTGPVLGNAEFEGNAALIRTRNGFMSIPTAALPDSVLNQNVFVRDPRGNVSQVPLQAALAMRREGSRLLTDPRVPRSALLSNVAVADSRGRVHNASLASALQNRRNTILGAAGTASMLRHVGRAALSTSGHQFGLMRPSRSFGRDFGRNRAGLRPGATFRPSMATHPSFNRGVTSAMRRPSFNRGMTSAMRRPSFNRGMTSAMRRPSFNRAPAYRPSFNRAPAYRPSYRPAAPAYRPAYHPSFRPAAPAYHPSFSRPAQSFSAPRPVFRAPQPTFRAPAPMMRAPAPAPMRAPMQAPVMRGGGGFRR